MHYQFVDPPAFTWCHVPEHRILTRSSVRPHRRDRIENFQSVVDRNREIGLSLLLREGFKGTKEAAATEAQEVRTDVYPDAIHTVEA
jgi:hypothetical protein